MSKAVNEETVREVATFVAILVLLFFGYSARIGALVLAYWYFGWPLVAVLVVGHVGACLTKSCWESFDK